VPARSGRSSGIALVNTSSTTPTAGTAIHVTGGDAATRVNYRDLYVQGFYDNVDVQVGFNWTWIGGESWQPVRYGLRVRNTITNDAGDWVVNGVHFMGHDTPSTAGVRLESAGAGRFFACKWNGADAGRFANAVDVATGSNVPITSILQFIGCSVENYSDNGIRIVGPGWPMIFGIGNEFGHYGVITGYPISITDCDNIQIHGCHFANTAIGVSLDNVRGAFLSNLSIGTGLDTQAAFLRTVNDCKNIYYDNGQDRGNLDWNISLGPWVNGVDKMAFYMGQPRTDPNAFLELMTADGTRVTNRPTGKAQLFRRGNSVTNDLELTATGDSLFAGMVQPPVLTDVQALARIADGLFTGSDRSNKLCRRVGGVDGSIVEIG
jgi:hypothetical protein